MAFESTDEHENGQPQKQRKRPFAGLQDKSQYLSQLFAKVQPRAMLIGHVGGGQQLHIEVNGCLQRQNLLFFLDNGFVLILTRIPGSQGST